MAGKSTLEERVGLLEIAVEYLTKELADKTAEQEQKDWPRRNCDERGCSTIIRAKSAADLPKFCSDHTPEQSAAA